MPLGMLKEQGTKQNKYPNRRVLRVGEASSSTLNAVADELSLAKGMPEIAF